MAGYRLSYSIDEDNKILQSIVDSRLYYVLRSDTFWKDLSAMGLLDRTWMSLQNRFKKTILPNISNPQYKIAELEKRKIELAWFQSSVEFQQDNKNCPGNDSTSDEDNDNEADDPDSSSNEDGNDDNEEPTVDDSTANNIPITEPNTNSDGQQS